ncbi:hypothetical protein [Allokutzneria oryzae]|uniref:Uncharacterized protein n=1 Tax=Allokutzneria oryzae TaxID=1378989 RepID=A0ABV5ZWK6_9PSEU
MRPRRFYGLDRALAGIQFLLDEAEVRVLLHEDGDFVGEESNHFGFGDE